MTPLMAQFTELKTQAGDALLLFRMGDFYELFGDDAVIASKILEITLTTRDKGKADAQPMAGVPHHSIQGYIQKLLRNGKKVAIADQLEDPTTVKAGKIVKRGITRVLTPGIQFDLDSSDPVYLGIALPMDTTESQWAVACLDASTGELLTSSGLTREGVQATLGRLPIRHWIHWGIEGAWDFSPATYVERLPDTGFSLTQARALLSAHYEAQALEAFFDSQTAVWAAGILVNQVLRTQGQERLNHLQRALPLVRSGALTLGAATPQHLDLFSHDQAPSLFDLVNRTRTAPGARQLKRWLSQPLRDPEAIASRQAGVQALSLKLSPLLGEVYDLERIAGRVATGLASPRDTLALGRSVAVVPALLRTLESAASSEWIAERRSALEGLQTALGPLAERILKTQREEAPLTSKDGGIFARGTDPELDRLVELSENGAAWLVKLEEREREATGIPSLKVRYNRVFGYYIEVTAAHSARVPAHYQRKQTMVGAERFFTEELKKFEEEILTASSRQKALELDLFARLIAEIRSLLPSLMDLAHRLAELDAATALRALSEEPGWVFPVIDGSEDLEIEALRHPMVDRALAGGFVPNSIRLDSRDTRTLLITGPNMGGKSTVMRQVALAAILGQIGAPVPARKARWGWFSSIYTRIGAQDAIARGQSTFMVEMSELAHLLHHADSRSLLVLDEIGRGTSTYDGISVAWSTLEWICRSTRARTLFATHYHELTKLEGQLAGMANFHMAVESSKAGARTEASFRFLYELKPGPASESFGIQVAALAGLPKGVIQRAWEVLDELESQPQTHAAPGDSPAQLTFFAPPSAQPSATAPAAAKEPAWQPHPAVEELAAADPNAMTPIQALNFVVKLQEIYREAQAKSG